jgi:hypothetical protein
LELFQVDALVDIGEAWPFAINIAEVDIVTGEEFAGKHAQGDIVTMD